MNLTYWNPDGSWGLNGVNWTELSKLPPQVYAALCKLKDLEHKQQETDDSQKQKGEHKTWTMQRFTMVQ